MELNFDLTPTEEKLQDSSKRFITNGMVDVVIDTAFINETKNDSKAQIISLVLKEAKEADNDKANTQTIFNAIILKKSTGEDSNGSNMLIKLALVSGLKAKSLSSTEPKKIKLGKEERTVNAIPELEGLRFIGKFQQEFSKYNEKISENIRLNNVFRPSDKASGQEIYHASQGTQVEFGKQYAQEAEFEIKPVYKDGLTEDIVKQSYTSNKPSKENSPQKSQLNGLLGD